MRIIFFDFIEKREDRIVLKKILASNQDPIEKKQIRKEILHIAGPALAELVMSTLFGMINMIMVGQISPAAIAAVGLTNQPFMLLIAIFAAVNTGTTTLVAWNIGAKNVENARSVTRQVIIVNLILGTLMSVLGIFSARAIVTFMGAEPDILELSTLYFQIIAAGLVFQAVTMGITAALRGAGETTLPMLYNIASNLINVMGNFLLIYGYLGFPKLGVTGSAISTSFSKLLACLAGLYVLYLSRRSCLNLKVKERFRFDLSCIKKVFEIGFPAALEQFVLQGGLILFARIVSSLGTEGFAAHQIGINISGLSFAPSMAFGVAATALVGQSLGANNAEKASRYISSIQRMAVSTACCIALIFILFSYPIARLYTNDAGVASMAGMVLKILALAQPGQSTQLSVAGALRGAGDTLYPLYASVFGIWIFRVAVAFIFVSVFHWGLAGAWVALVLDQYTRSAIVFLRFRSGKWKHAKTRTVGVVEVGP